LPLDGFAAFQFHDRGVPQEGGDVIRVEASEKVVPARVVNTCWH
jgi:hypothetical protein